MTRKRAPQFLGTWIALVALLGLGAYIYFVESKRPAGDEKPKEKVFGFDREKARELTLSGAGRETVRAVKEGEGWRLVEPRPAPAAASEVRSVIQTLADLEIADVVSETGGAASEYGLDPPRGAVSVTVEGQAAPAVLHVGDETPDGASVYAKLPEQPRVFTAPRWTNDALLKTAFALRDRDLLHVARDAVRSLSVTGPDGNWTASREGESWWITAPLRTRAGRWTVDGLVGALESLRMESVVAEQADDVRVYGLQPPARTVTVGLADGGTKTLEIGSKTADGRYHARVSGAALVAAIAPAVADDLAKGLGEYRARRLLDVSAHEVTGLDVETAGGKRTLSRTAATDESGGETFTWKQTAPAEKDVKTTDVQDAVFEVGGLEVTSFVDAPQAPAAYGLDTPALKVELRFTGSRPAESFALGQKDGRWHARRSGDAAVLVLDAAKAEALVERFAKL